MSLWLPEGPPYSRMPQVMIPWTHETMTCLSEEKTSHALKASRGLSMNSLPPTDPPHETPPALKANLRPSLCQSELAETV